MAQTVKIVTLENLQSYDSKIKNYITENISESEAKSLKSVAIVGNTLKFYKETAPIESTSPAFSITLPETDISNLLQKFASAKAGDVVTIAADGKNIADSGVKVADLATNAKVKAVSDLVGTIPSDATATTVTGYAKELADAATYDDTALAGRVTTVEGKVQTLQGADTVDGSVAKQIKDAKTELTTEINKKATKATTLAGYGIGDAYTKTQADSAIATAVANADHLKREIVSTLPAVASADANTIYMVSKTDGSGNQKHDEYMLVNGAFEKVGDSAVDLTNYATKTEVNTAKSEAIADANEYADGLASNYATAAQGTKADSALQKADIAPGTSNGNISVKGTNVAVKGLASAAYKTAGSASGNVPVNGAALGTTANVPVVTNASGQLIPHASGALGTAAFTASSAYATSAQGTLADSALQKADIASGTSNGTIKVDGTDVAVKGLGSAAYTASSSYATSAQGQKADSAVQAVTAGTTNGTISVDGTAVAIPGYSTLAGKVAALEGTTYVELTEAEINAMFE